MKLRFITPPCVGLLAVEPKLIFLKLSEVFLISDCLLRIRIEHASCQSWNSAVAPGLFGCWNVSSKMARS